MIRTFTGQFLAVDSAGREYTIGIWREHHKVAEGAYLVYQPGRRELRTIAEDWPVNQIGEDEVEIMLPDCSRVRAKVDMAVLIRFRDETAEPIPPAAYRTLGSQVE